MTEQIKIGLIFIGLICSNCKKENQIEETIQCPNREETLLLKSQTIKYNSGSEQVNVWEYNAQDWEIGYKEITITNSIIEHENYKFDNRGNILYYDRLLDGSLNNVVKRSYSTNNLITSDSVFNSQEELIRYETWTYMDNVLTNYKFLIPQANQTVHLHKEHKNFQYDDRNQLIQYDTYNRNGHNLTIRFIYNEQGLLISKLSERVSDDYTYEELNDYNSDCLLTDKKIVIWGEERTHWTNYQYNSNGSYIYREAYKDGILYSSEERTFE